MLTIKQIADQYGLSRSTARRRVLECFPGIELEKGKQLVLDADQASAFAHFMGKLGKPYSPAAPETPQEPDTATVAIQRERIRGLEERVAFLETEVERLHAALEREQEKATPALGFWARLGQRILPPAR